jgi:hypothetical protein
MNVIDADILVLCGWKGMNGTAKERFLSQACLAERERFLLLLA